MGPVLGSASLGTVRKARQEKPENEKHSAVGDCMTRMAIKEDINLLEGGKKEEAVTENSDWVRNKFSWKRIEYIFNPRQLNKWLTQKIILSLMVLKHLLGR